MDLWEARSLPVLRWVAAHDGAQTMIRLGEIGAELSLTADQVCTELERLRDSGLVHVRMTKHLGNSDLGSCTSCA
jgi:DNA-binding transcriptional regulator LsrR (DeoR family)